MQLTNILLLAAALGATAHPSGHANVHRSADGKRAFYKAVHPNRPPPPAKTTPAAAPPAVVPTPAKETPAAPSAAPAAAAAYKPFCGGAKSKRASHDDIHSTGNTGTTDNYGCNIMVVDKSVADKYDYTSVYTNVAAEPYEVVCGNKIGRDGGVNGFFESALVFNLAPGEAKTVAFDTNTQGFCAFAPNKVPKTPYGAWGGVWVEYDFASGRNKGWSGADCSSLVSVDANLDIPGCQVCTADDVTCSTIFPGGEGHNAFIAGTAAMDGLGINHPAGPAKLKVKVGYTHGA